MEKRILKNRNTITLVLMLSSLGLLLMLQVFWLRGAYLSAEGNFQRETNNLFRHTILAMYDTVIQRNLEPLREDSVFGQMRVRRSHFARDVGAPATDSIIDFVRITERGNRIDVVSTGKPDTLGRLLRPMLDRAHRGPGDQAFVLRLGGDTLAVDSIRIQFNEALKKADMEVPFKVIANKSVYPRKIQMEIDKPKGIMSEAVHIGPLTDYAVSFSGSERLLLKEILPQIMFSIFLTLLTSISFYVMYKNLTGQQRLMEIKNDFISNITHELKTPVATVSVTLEALKNFNALKNPVLSEEYLDIAQRELNRLNEITDRILKTSVLEKEIVITAETSDLSEIVTKVLNDMAILLTRKNVKVSFKKNGTDFSLHCDAYHLYKVIENLIDNALKYSTNEPVIDLSLSDSPTSIVLTVKDQGIGIQKEYQDKIFEKFFRVPTGDVQTVKGYGLGLSYVYNVIKSLGGKIHVESIPGEGSTFVLQFPKIVIKNISLKVPDKKWLRSIFNRRNI